MFSETNNMDQDSSKNRLALVKTNRVSKHVLSVQKLCCSCYEYKKDLVRILSRHYILKKRKIIIQVASKQ